MSKLLDWVADIGRGGLNRVAAVGRSGQILAQALIAKPTPFTMFPLLVKQLYFVGVLSLLIIVVSGS